MTTRYNFLDRLGVLFDPRFWIRVESVSREWGETVEKLMDEYEPRYVDRYTIFLGDTQVWVESWPFAFGRKWRGAFVDSPVPPRRTAIRLRKLIDGAL